VITSPWQFTWCRSWEEVWAPEFLAQWGDIINRAGTVIPYHRPGLVRAWAETVGAALGARPMVGVARDQLGTTVLLPWVIEPGHGRLLTRRRLLPAGAGVLGYGRPLVASVWEPDWTTFWPALIKDVSREVDLIEVPLLDAALAAGAPSMAAGDPCPVLDLTGASSLDDLTARCSPKFRKEIRRSLRGMQQAGDVEFRLVAPAARHEAVAALDRDLLPAYEEHWPAATGRALLAWPLMREFLTRVIADGLEEGWAQFAVLSLDHRPIAWHLGFVEARDWYWWMPTYDPAQTPLSPGKVLLARLIETAVTSGVERLHLQAGAQPYKMSWRPALPELVTVRAYGASVRGRLLQGYDWTQSA
jgi:CelD/BcsL family acetyltransferase involved in cellulose biosynthesis